MIRTTVAHNVAAAKAKPINRIEFVDDEFMSNKQIAKKFAISADAVLDAQNRGELAYCVFGDPAGTRRLRRSPRRAVLEWAAARVVIRESVA
jgi:DMSO/TMAO reductase YedYZ molybdopterin-dependent catalytic subunit